MGLGPSRSTWSFHSGLENGPNPLNSIGHRHFICTLPGGPYRRNFKYLSQPECWYLRLMEITAFCSKCKKFEAGWDASPDWQCPTCQSNLLPFATDAFKRDRTLDQCPICGCAHLYRQKDF